MAQVWLGYGLKELAEYFPAEFHRLANSLMSLFTDGSGILPTSCGIEVSLVLRVVQPAIDQAFIQFKMAL